MEGRFSDAVEHLETGRRLEPDNRSVYAALAHAYRKLGNAEMARQMDAQLAKILAEEKQSAVRPPQ